MVNVVGLVPDNEVRVSVKALAVSCVGAAAALLPETFFNKLYLQPLDGQQSDGKKHDYLIIWSGVSVVFVFGSFSECFTLLVN